MKPHLEERGLLKKVKKKKIKISPLLKQALRQAKSSHKNQKRDDGSSYLLEYIYPVACDILNCGKNCNEKMLATALLHDVLEDDPKMDAKKFKNLFGIKIYNCVKILTKNKKDNSPGSSEKRKREINRNLIKKLEKKNRCTKLVKLADRTNNLASFSLPAVNKKKLERYLKETKEFIIPFAKRENEYSYKKLTETYDRLSRGEDFK